VINAPDLNRFHSMILSDKFCEIGHSVANSAAIKVQRKMCPDQWVGQIASSCRHVNDFHSREPAIPCKKLSRVVLIMESPHTQEFVGSPGPAKGRTGFQIRQHLTKLPLESDISTLELILVNSIQYQCSLGVNAKIHRDKVFRRFWEEGGQENFEERLKQLYSLGDVLLNCCTDGNPSKGIRNLVTSAIHNSLGMVPLYSGPHPYSWFSEQNRQSLRFFPGSSSHIHEP
jgi:hypothetical protein